MLRSWEWNTPLWSSWLDVKYGGIQHRGRGDAHSEHVATRFVIPASHLLPTARQFYRESFHYLEAVDAAKGKFDAALDVIEVLPENFETYRYTTAPEKPTEEESLEDFRVLLSNWRNLSCQKRNCSIFNTTT